MQPLDIISSVSRHLAAFWVAAMLLAACGPNIKSKQKVQEAILNRLQARSGLNLNALDVTTTAVSFDKNMAYATVAFHQKDDTRLNSGMVMKYTLENRGGKWVVVSVGDSHGRSLTAPIQSGANELPPGHPPVSGMDPAAVPPPHGGTQVR